jgi:hypothetical protein
MLYYIIKVISFNVFHKSRTVFCEYITVIIEIRAMLLVSVVGHRYYFPQNQIPSYL